jgi:hypothetical protein
MKFISIDYYITGNSVPKCQDRAVQKKVKETIFHHILQGYTIAVEDESIFIHDTLIRRRMCA